MILTLVFTVILASVILAMANYATTGLATSDVPTYRTDTNFDASSTVTWAIEELTKKQLTPDADCGYAPAYDPIPLPSGLVPNGYSAALTCAQTTPITGEPVVHLISTVTSASGSSRFVEATIEVPRYVHDARVADWRVDLHIQVPAYVPPSGNFAPSANPTTWSAVSDGVASTQTVAGTDSDGTIVSSVISGLPVGWTATTTGNSVQLTVPVGTTDGVYNLTYTVTDDDGATSSAGTIQATVTSPPNVPPTAGTSNWTAISDGVASTQGLAGFDTDGTIVSSVISGLPLGWTATTTGNSVQLTVPVGTTDGVYNLTYTVTDDDVATSSPGTIQVTVSATPPPNLPPTANATSWSVTAGTTTTQSLLGTDTDGTIVSSAISGLPASPAWTATTTGNSVQLTIPTATSAGIYNLTYTVTDDDGAISSAGTIQVNVSAAPPVASCTFSVTSHGGGGNSGNGTLTVSNAGGEFTGWSVRLTQLSAAKPWTFTWPVSVSATASGQFVNVTGTQTIAANGSFSASASLTQSGTPKIDTGQTLTCTVVSP